MKSLNFKMLQNLKTANTGEGDAFPLGQNLASHSSTQSIEKDEVLFLVLDRILDGLAERNIPQSEAMTLQKWMSSPLPLSLRPKIFEKINHILGGAMAQVITDGRFYHHIHSIVTLIKMQIDSNPQENQEMAEWEWRELEKSIYLLTDWEDMIFQDQPNQYYQ